MSRFVWPTISVLVAVASLSACSRPVSKSRGSVRFADGSELSIEVTTFGTRHSFITDGNTHFAEFEKDKLVAWVSFAPKTLTPHNALAHALSLDSHGCALISNDDPGTWSSRGTSAPWPFGYLTAKLVSRSSVGYFPIGVFPRREPSFKLDFLHPDNTAGGAAFEVATPIAGPFPSWTPEPLPSTK
ncbi:MAG TPA: hypothetical protein VFV34_05980, partial [Blastocatellia bacterium]|nr:hypothetical protein [Blastocatellia bacterium]